MNQCVSSHILRCWILWPSGQYSATTLFFAVANGGVKACWSICNPSSVVLLSLRSITQGGQIFFTVRKRLVITQQEEKKFIKCQMGVWRIRHHLEMKSKVIPKLSLGALRTCASGVELQVFGADLKGQTIQVWHQWVAVMLVTVKIIIFTRAWNKKTHTHTRARARVQTK